jgi:hypothetical protein
MTSCVPSKVLELISERNELSDRITTLLMQIGCFSDSETSYYELYLQTISLVKDVLALCPKIDEEAVNKHYAAKTLHTAICVMTTAIMILEKGIAAIAASPLEVSDEDLKELSLFLKSKHEEDNRSACILWADGEISYHGKVLDPALPVHRASKMELHESTDSAIDHIAVSSYKEAVELREKMREVLNKKKLPDPDQEAWREEIEERNLRREFDPDNDEGQDLSDEHSAYFEDEERFHSTEIRTDADWYDTAREDRIDPEFGQCREEHLDRYGVDLEIDHESRRYEEL